MNEPGSGYGGTINPSLTEEIDVTDKKPEKEMCPFDPDQVKAEDCKHAEGCPWYVKEGDDKCFCAVGEEPDLMLRKMLAAKVEEDAE